MKRSSSDRWTLSNSMQFSPQEAARLREKAGETAASAERHVAFCPRGEGQSEVALGSGRSCVSRAAVPDVRVIETTLAGGTVARDIVCAGLSEHRTRAA